MLSRVTRLLGIQVESKVPLLDALKLTRQAAGNVFFEELIASAEDAATRGQPVSSAFAASLTFCVSSFVMLSFFKRSNSSSSSSDNPSRV